MKISDYVKLEELKQALTTRLLKNGLKDRVEGMVDDDLNKLMQLMAALNTYLYDKETDEERLQLLVNYIIGLWGILIIDYQHPTEEL
jgi:hypothetical protein